MNANSRWIRLGVLVCFTAFAAFSATITFTGPVFVKGPNEGKPCTPGVDSFCIIGEPLDFQVFSAKLTTPNGNPNWTLEIQTNYGAPLPGSPDVIPAYYNVDVNGTFTMGDFLIQWNGTKYGIALTPHDGYVAGNLYKSPDGYLTSHDVLSKQPNTQEFNPTHNVLLAPASGGDPSVNKLGDGTLSASKTGDGLNSALYTIMVSFSAPAGFLVGSPFSIDFSSYACANGIVMGTAELGQDVPEPSTVFMCLPALAMGFVIARRRRNRLS